MNYRSLRVRSLSHLLIFGACYEDETLETRLNKSISTPMRPRPNNPADARSNNIKSLSLLVRKYKLIICLTVNFLPYDREQMRLK